MSLNPNKWSNAPSHILCLLRRSDTLQEILGSRESSFPSAKAVLITSTSFPQFCWKTHPKPAPVICSAQRKQLLLIYLFQFYQISLFAHTRTHAHKQLDFQCWENKHSSDLPSSGALWALCEISIYLDKSWPGKGTKAQLLASHCHLARSIAAKDTRLYCAEWDYTRACTRTHTQRGSALSLCHRRNIDLMLASASGFKLWAPL